MLGAVVVDVVSDVVCPWCYIGKRRLEAAIAQMLESEPDLTFEVRWHPFQLNPGLPGEGVDRKAYLEAKFGGPERAKQVESKWDAVVGAGTTLAQVLDAKRAYKGSSDRAGAIARFAAGAAFVMLEDLPSADELTWAALANGWQSVHRDLVNLDGVDDVDLGATSASRTTD